MSREKEGEIGKQTKWQRDVEIGLSETERKVLLSSEKLICEA